MWMTVLRWAWGVFVLCACSGVGAKDVSWAPGTYVTQGGWGKLVLQTPTSQGQAFAIESTGANGHSCSLEGVVVQGEARLPLDAQTCVVRFGAAPQGAITVGSTTPEVCRDFCGARAGFEGSYSALPFACEPKAWAASGKDFMRAYQARDYVQAVKVQLNRLRTCEASLFWFDAYQVRNDLAIAQFRAGQSAACRDTLGPIMAVKPDDLPPADAEGFAPIIKAARFNWGKCGGK